MFFTLSNITCYLQLDKLDTLNITFGLSLERLDGLSGENKITKEKFMKKAAVIVLSDPKTGSEESLGRLFNALAAVYDFKKRGQEVQLLFAGAGSRWAGELVNREHPAYALFASVKDKTAGVSCGCADVFGAQEGVAASGLDLITENAVPNTTGLPSLARLTEEGYTILTF